MMTNASRISTAARMMSTVELVPGLSLLDACNTTASGKWIMAGTEACLGGLPVAQEVLLNGWLFVLMTFNIQEDFL